MGNISVVYVKPLRGVYYILKWSNVQHSDIHLSTFFFVIDIFYHLLLVNKCFTLNQWILKYQLNNFLIAVIICLCDGQIILYDYVIIFFSCRFSYSFRLPISNNFYCFVFIFLSSASKRQSFLPCLRCRWSS